MSGVMTTSARRAGLALVAFDGDAEAALEDAEERVEVAFGERRDGQAEGEDDIGVHVVDGLGGQVGEDGAIDELVSVDFDRTVDAGDGDGGADCVGQRAASEGDGAGDGDIGGEAAKGNGEIVELGAVVVAEELGVEEGVEALIGEDGVAEGDAVAEADGDAVGEFAAVFAAAEVAGFVGGVEAEDGVEDRVVHDDLQLGRRFFRWSRGR